MKRNKLHILEGAKASRLSRSEALHLVELYFDAETTEHQEFMLRDYVVNEGKDDVAFNEVRAFMGLMAYARSRGEALADSSSDHVDLHADCQQKPLDVCVTTQFERGVITSSTHSSISRAHRLSVVRKVAAIAAVVCVVCSATLTITHYKMQNQCVAYVDGHKTTDRDEVVRVMRQSVADVGFDEGNAVVKDQLHDMFNTINSTE